MQTIETEITQPQFLQWKSGPTPLPLSCPNVTFSNHSHLFLVARAFISGTTAAHLENK